MDKVYIVMIHKTGENAGVFGVYSTSDKAKVKVEELNKQYEFLGRNDLWADFISEELQ